MHENLGRFRICRPSGYEWKKNANEVIDLIKASDFHINRVMELGHQRFLERNYGGRDKCYAHATKWDIAEINMSEDFSNGDDAKKLMAYLEEIGRVDYYSMKTH